MTEAYDKIHIRDLKLSCIIGIKPVERIKKQTVLVNITLRCDLRPAGATDDIDDTIDYKSVKNEIIEFVENSSFFLIEALAHNVAELCLARHGVTEVTVTIDKPGALRYARSVAVEICRKKRPNEQSSP